MLERLSGELCDAVTGRPGSQALLEEAERAGLFVVPLDEVRFAQGIAGRRAAGLPTWGAWASYELGQVQHAQGRLDAGPPDPPLKRLASLRLGGGVRLPHRPPLW